jgi:hypothetical protein
MMFLQKEISKSFRREIMKKLLILFLLPLFLFGSLDFGGFLEVGKTVFTGLKDSPYYPIYNRLRVEGRAGSGNVRGLLSFEARFYDFPFTTSTGSLTDVDELYPISLSLYEAYFTITGFVIDDIDLKVGKQRIAWGTADEFNPTDNLNPIDLSNPFNFGENMPSLALQLNYYVGDLVITAIGIPAFTPALLPADTIILTTVPDVPMNLPELSPQNGSYAFKIGTNIFNYDVSMSYYYGYDKLPSPDSIGIGGYELNPTFGFNREKVIGFDFAGELFTTGIWGEVAYFIPDEYPTTLVAPSPFPPFRTEVDTFYIKSSYLRATFGFDYTFAGGFYMNAQYIHGMDFERKLMIGDIKNSSLGDYIIVRMEKEFSPQDILLSLAGLGEKRGDFFAYGVIPEIEYSPFANSKVTMGYLHTFGDEDTFFGDLKRYKMAYLRFKFDF